MTDTPSGERAMKDGEKVIDCEKCGAWHIYYTGVGGSVGVGCSCSPKPDAMKENGR